MFGKGVGKLHVGVNRSEGREGTWQAMYGAGAWGSVLG